MNPPIILEQWKLDVLLLKNLFCNVYFFSVASPTLNTTTSSNKTT